MNNVITLNGETYVRVSSVTNHGLFTSIYFVNRRSPKDLEYSRGVPFMRLEDAEAYKESLERTLGLCCFISQQSVYTCL